MNGNEKILYLETLRENEKITIKTRLNDKIILPIYLIRAKTLKDFYQQTARLNLNLFCKDQDIIAYRIVKRFQDVYSYVRKTISIHPSQFDFLTDNDVSKIFTFSKTNNALSITACEDFTDIEDLGIGYLRRAPIKLTKIFNDQVCLDETRFHTVAEIKTKEIIDELLRVKLQKTVKPVETDENQRSLFQ